MAADGFSVEVLGWTRGSTSGTATVRIKNHTQQANSTWLEISCEAMKGFHNVVARDFGFYRAPIQPGGEVITKVRVEFYGDDADRAQCEVNLTDKTE
jgi:hypothetical protein